MATNSQQAERRTCVLDGSFREDLEHWVETERRIAVGILKLVEAVLRDPFGGIGKPERLRGLESDTWSRRITQEHRLVYRVTDDRITFLQALRLRPMNSYGPRHEVATHPPR